MSTSFIHPQAICEAAVVGDGSTVAAFSRIVAGAVLGSNVTIHENVSVGSDVTIGDGVVVHAGSQLWGALEIQPDAVIGQNVTFAMDTRDTGGDVARSEITTIGQGAAIGAGTVVLAGVSVGRKAVTAPGSVVTLDVPPHAIAAGNPAQVTGYTDANNRRLAPRQKSDRDLVSTVEATGLTRLTTAVDMRGNLVALEFSGGFPFVPQRFFFVYGVSSRDVRGEHAHRECHQFLVCVAGSVKAVIDDGTTRTEHQLDDPSLGLYMPPMTWGTQYAYSSDAILVVFASHAYDAHDYIRDYSTFRAEIDLARGTGTNL